MKYTIYQDAITRQFAHLPLPSRFRDGDRLPVLVTDRWFESHEAAIAALAELLDRDEGESSATAPVPEQVDAALRQGLDPAAPPAAWSEH